LVTVAIIGAVPGLSMIVNIRRRRLHQHRR